VYHEMIERRLGRRQNERWTARGSLASFLI